MAKTAAKGMALLGLLCGIAYSVGGFFYDLATTGLNLGTLLAFGALVGMPVIFGVVGLALGAVAALLARLAGRAAQ
jgi:hypothetical protein